jgi:predicted alpha-1,2-mannosidase
MGTSAMTRRSLPALTLALAVTAGAEVGERTSSSSRVDRVDVFAGTSNSRWMLGPGPSLPNGMVKLGPDNQGNVWNGGYEYTVSSISGFSHLHGMGLSGLSIMPAVNTLEPEAHQLRVFPGPADGPFGEMWTAGYRSRFDKTDEHGFPGYYSVRLRDSGVQVELTSTTRCGMLRLTWPEAERARLLIDFAAPAEEKVEVLEVRVRRVGDSGIEGSVRQRNQYAGEHHVHFVVELSRPFEAMDGWTAEPHTGSDTVYGTVWRQARQLRRDRRWFEATGESGVLLRFKTQADERIVVRTSVSLVDVAGARRNLEREILPHGFDFDKVAAVARETWEGLLARIDVEGRPEDERTFYTNLYRAFAARTIVSDVDGRYVDGCGIVRQLEPPADAVYSSDGFWGAQFTLFPLWTLVAPDVTSSWIHSFLELSRHGGWIPEAPVALEYAPIMGAQHHNSLIISAYQKGQRSFDVERAYQAIHHDYTTPGIEHPCGGFAGNRHLAPYLELGYVPDQAGPVSNTMEYAYDDWAFAQLAKALGRDDDARSFMKRSRSWRNVWDPGTGYVRRRHADGRWVEPFDPFRFGTEGGWNGPGYMEGNAWIYSLFVPHDLPGLIEVMGGADAFSSRVEEGFERGHVDLSNQPNLQAPFLFVYAGKPWLTQRHVRRALATLFDTSAFRGWPGEEDEGQMGALFVLLSMGLFEMDGGCSIRPFYEIGSPLFDRVRIRPSGEDGPTFEIVASGNSPENVYVQSASLNGRPLSRAWLYHSEIVTGGRLELVMGPEPNPAWGSAPRDLPPPHDR